MLPAKSCAIESSITPPIVAIVGPTAVGKSRMAMELAERFDGEIISADSRQVYRLLDIGTDKPSRAEQARIRHHVIDVAYPDEQYTAARFRDQATMALKSISDRGKVAFLVGGTGHYVRVLLDRSSVPPVPPDAERRQRIEQRIQRLGIDSVLQEIASIDPVSAVRIDRSNPRRVVRAMEILEVTGEPIAPLSKERLPALTIGLNTDRAELYRIADARIDRHITEGLLEETATVQKLGYSLDLPALRGLAYREIGLHLRGELTLAAAIEAYKFATHRLIRRQLTWFRTEEEATWLDPSDAHAVVQAAELITAFLNGRAQRDRKLDT